MESLFCGSSPLCWTVLTKRLMSVMFDDSDPNKTEQPVYLVAELSMLVLIQVSVFKLRQSHKDWVLNDMAVTTVCIILTSQENQWP